MYIFIIVITLGTANWTIFSSNWDPRLSYEHKLSDLVIARLNGSLTCQVLTYLCCCRVHDPLATAEYAMRYQSTISPATYSTLMALSVSGQITYLPTLVRIGRATNWYERQNRTKNQDLKPHLP